MLLHKGSHILFDCNKWKRLRTSSYVGVWQEIVSIFRLSIRGYLGKGGREKREGEKA